MSKDDIHAQLWPDTFVSEVTLHSLMSELLRVLGDDAERPRFIRTVHGFGYAFVGPVEIAGWQPRRWLVRFAAGSSARRDG